MSHAERWQGYGPALRVPLMRCMMLLEKWFPKDAIYRHSTCQSDLLLSTSLWSVIRMQIRIYAIIDNACVSSDKLLC